MKDTGEFTCQAVITFGTGWLEALKRFKSKVRMKMLRGQRGRKILYWEDSASGLILAEKVGICGDINLKETFEFVSVLKNSLQKNYH